ncbi:MAG: DHH family phosphoesterase [Verrucomicrobia bacterium]|nr:DHH family phosphoesterase [Verrucomicrobiota bacterium]
MNFPLPRPEVILTHESDLDGFVSGLLLQRLARKLFGDDVKLEAWNYQGWKNRALHERSAWVCDLAFEPRLDKQNWVVIDHHPTEAKATHALLIHDASKSAGSLCYDLCREHGLATAPLDRLVQLNNVADLFLEDDPDFIPAGDYASLVKTYQFWNLHALLGGELEKLMNHPLLEVMAVKRRVEDPLGFEWSKTNVLRISPTIGLVDTVIGNTNAIVHRLLEEKAVPYSVLITLFFKTNRSVIASLRSRNGEAAKAAALLQGGGHPNAAGATLPRSVQTLEDAIFFLRKTLDDTRERTANLNTLDHLFDSLKLEGK